MLLEVDQTMGMRAWKIMRPPLVAGAVLAGQMARAIYREDLPSLENQDPSGVFGSADAPPLTIVFLGDSSITAPGVDPLDSSWPRQLAMHLADRYRVTAISVAVGGSKIRDVLDSQVDQALALRPDIAYLSAGSNDALRATPIARFEADYDRAVRALHTDVPAVGLSGIGDLGTIPRLPELAKGFARIRARAVDRAIARVSRHYPNTVKSNAWDVMQQMFTTDSPMFGADLFHASAEGHLAFASVGVHVADRLVDVWQEQISETHG
ncbi:MAG: hypothetical protein BMS9Abin17_0921 [Acidimicrobiia bacterium]|nr:MAG: hypothetical protein BMS9Abin17_0921 [Acidimicrobiia bacterium]